MIEMGKTYRTRDGREVRIYAVDVPGVRPVHGARKTDSDNWCIACWSANGQHGDYMGLPFDLIEVKPKITRTYNLLHWKAGHASAYPSDESLARYRELMRTQNDPLAITGPHTIEFTEGEGLEPSR